MCTHCARNMLGTTIVSHTQPWKTPEHRQNHEKTRKSCFFLVLRLSTLSTSPNKTWRTCSKKKKKHGLIRFSFAWKPFCNDLEVNRARGDREIRLWKMSGRTPPFWLVPGSITWTQKRTRTLTWTPIFIFSRSPVNYTSEAPQNSFLQTMKSFRVKSSENKSKTCENHVFSRVFTCTSLFWPNVQI